MMQPPGARRPLLRRCGCGSCLLTILLLLVLGVAVVYGVTLITSPWAIHIGGSTTPLLHWDGYGEGVTPAGTHVAVALSLGPRQASSGLGLWFGGGLRGHPSCADVVPPASPPRKHRPGARKS